MHRESNSKFALYVDVELLKFLSVVTYDNNKVRTGYGILEKQWNFEKEIPYMEKQWNFEKEIPYMEKLWNFIKTAVPMERLWNLIKTTVPMKRQWNFLYGGKKMRAFFKKLGKICPHFEMFVASVITSLYEPCDNKKKERDIQSSTANTK